MHVQVVTTIEALSAPTAAPDASKAEVDVQQALSLLATQQPISLELHAKLAKAAVQAGAMTGAVQSANALLALGLPKGRSAADIVDIEDAPGVAQRDWQWLAVGSLVLGQVCIHAVSPAAWCNPFSLPVDVRGRLMRSSQKNSSVTVL